MDAMSETPLEIGQRVELIPGREGVYKSAVAGSQGVIKHRKVDDEGFPMVFVEWDKSHWRYAGEDDGWTYESHLRPLKGVEFFSVLENREEFLAEMFTRIDDADSPEYADAFLKNMNAAITLLADCDGFFVLGMKQEPDPEDSERTVIVPYIHSGFLTEEIMALLEAQIVGLAAMSFQEMVGAILANIASKQDDEEE